MIDSSCSATRYWSSWDTSTCISFCSGVRSLSTHLAQMQLMLNWTCRMVNALSWDMCYVSVIPSTVIQRSSQTMVAAVLIMISVTAVAGELGMHSAYCMACLNCLNHENVVDCGRIIFAECMLQHCRQMQNFKGVCCSSQTNSNCHK